MTSWPEQRQVERRGESGGAGADYRHLAIRGRQFARHNARGQGVEAVRLVDGIGDGAVHLAHVDARIQRAPPAAVVAGVLADAAGGGGQRVVHHHGFERLLDAAFLVELQEARDVHVQRATVLARRQRQVVAHAGAAAFGADVVLELVAEVAHGGQQRVGRGLSEAAERGVADHAPHLVEAVQIGLAWRARA